MASKAIYGAYIPLERRMAFQAEKRDQRRKWLEAQHARNPRCRYCRLPTTMQRRGFASKVIDHETSRHATLEHRVPLSAGGADNPGNWGLSCATCNALKADMPEADFVQMLIAEGIRE